MQNITGHYDVLENLCLQIRSCGKPVTRNKESDMWWGHGCRKSQKKKHRYLEGPRPEVGKMDIFSHPKKKWKKNGYSGKAGNGKKMDISRKYPFFSFFLDFRQEKPEMEKKLIFSRNIHFFPFFRFSAFPKNIHFFPFFLGVGNISIFFHFLGGWEKIYFFLFFWGGKNISLFFNFFLGWENYHDFFPVFWLI